MSRPLILDTNLLVLFVVGSAGHKLIKRHKRLSGFTPADHDQIVKMVAACSRLLLVPHVLTETSNLARQVDAVSRTEVSAILKLLVDRFPEEPVSSAEGAQHSQYLALGLTDAVLLRLCAVPQAVLMTTDHDLYGAALGEGRDAHHFNHFKAAAFASSAGPSL